MPDKQGIYRRDSEPRVESRSSTSVCMCSKGKGGKQIDVERRQGKVTSYLCRMLTVTSGSTDFGESYIDCERAREKENLCT